MSVIELGYLHTSARTIGISDAEWAVFRNAKHSDALAFYLALRRSLTIEYETRRPFHLPARHLAAQAFLPQRRDRKLYMRLRDELIRLGLIECVRKAGFSAQGRRTAAAFMFTTALHSPSDTVVFLTSYRKVANAVT
jgi:hypothetical protein